MLPEIGSDFWEYDTVGTPKGNRLFFWMNSDYYVQFYKSGRNAIKALCRNIHSEKKMVFLPAYTCETVIEPFVDEGWEIQFIQVDKNFSINIQSFMELYSKKKPTLVLVHSYFGFNTISDDRFLLQCKRDGVVIVEDLTQSLFSEHHIPYADYYVSSLRKFFAIPDGGVLCSRNPLECLENRNCDDKLLNTALCAFQLKKEYMQKPMPGLKTQFRSKYREVNELIEDNRVLQKANSISIDILYSIDCQTIREKRKSNYLQLYCGLQSTEEIQFVFDDNLTGITPMFFPIYVDNRDLLQKYAGMNNIYCPVIWPKSELVDTTNRESDYMYEHILCIPIDQRYGAEEMNRIIDVFQSFYTN